VLTPTSAGPAPGAQLVGAHIEDGAIGGAPGGRAWWRGDCLPGLQVQAVVQLLEVSSQHVAAGDRALRAALPPHLIQQAGGVVQHDDMAVAGAGGGRAALVGALDAGVGRYGVGPRI
jgi:hypothetical protein